VFYLDSPEQYQTAAYRSMVLARPGTLLIPEDVPESWLQFSAPMVWWSGDNINWQVVPRNIYGDQGWGIYFHQDLTNPTMAADLEADAELGSAVLTEAGWMGPNQPQVQAAESLYAAAAAVDAARLAETNTGGVTTSAPPVVSSASGGAAANGAVANSAPAAPVVRATPSNSSAKKKPVRTIEINRWSVLSLPKTGEYRVLNWYDEIDFRAMRLSRPGLHLMARAA